MMDELEIQRAIMATLKAHGIWHRRNNTGKARGGKFNVGLGPGGPDLLAVYRGRPIALEVKSETGKQSEDQKRWQVEWVGAGGEYHVVRSVADALAAVLGQIGGHVSCRPRWCGEQCKCRGDEP